MEARQIIRRFTMSRTRAQSLLLLATTVGLLLSTSQKSHGQDTFHLGAAAPSNYAVLARTSGVSITGPSGVLGSAGNVGVAGGNFSMSDGVISGVLSINTHGSMNISGGTQIQGGVVQNTANDSVLAAASNAAQNQSAYYAGLASTGTYPKSINISNPSNNVTLTGHSGMNVVNLSSINLTNGVLTLSAHSDGVFVVNVAGGFTINSACYIALSGGLTPFNVLINVIGSGSVVTINGSTKVTENGIILAPYRSISYHDQTIDGALIGAQVTITAGGHEVDNATPPSTGCSTAATFS